MNAEAPVIIDVEYTEADWLEYLRGARRKAIRAAWPIWIVYGSVMALLVAWAILASVQPARRASGAAGTPASRSSAVSDFLVSWLPSLIAIAVIVVAVRWYNRRQARRLFHGRGFMQRPHRMTFGPDGFTIVESLSSHDYRWAAVTRVRETKRQFLLYTSEIGAWLVPKRCLSGEDAPRFRRLLDEHVRADTQGGPAFPVLPAKAGGSS